MTDRAATALSLLQKLLGEQATEPEERATRALEEMIELARCFNVERAVVDKLVERAYSRPPGNPGIEFGQTQLTLEMLARVLHYDLDRAAADELRAIQIAQPGAIQGSAKRKIEGGIAHRRRTGRTTQQLKDAPKGATYICPRSDKAYTARLAATTGRSDLYVITADGVTEGSTKARAAPVILDHAAQLTEREWEVYQYIRARHPA